MGSLLSLMSPAVVQLVLLTAACAIPSLEAAGSSHFRPVKFELAHSDTPLQTTSVQARYSAGPKGAKMELIITGVVRDWTACENAHCRGEVATMIYESGRGMGSNNTRDGIHHPEEHLDRALFLQPAHSSTFETFKLHVEVVVRSSKSAKRGFQTHIVAQRYGIDPVVAEQKEIAAAEQKQRERNGEDLDEHEDEEPAMHHEESALDLAIR